jgi:N-acetylglutamate synthase-like GNAT family acetyltransferase
MELRPAKASELNSIKYFVDSVEEDIIASTYSLNYYKRLHKEGILIVAESDGLIGVCFGSFSKKEKWADLLIVAVEASQRKRGTGSMLVLAFEQVANEKGAKTIDYFANETQIEMMKGLGFKQGPKYISFRKEF